MRAADFTEKRRFKRLDLSLPMTVRNISEDGKEKAQKGSTINVSFNGAYIVDIGVKNIKPEDGLDVSLRVPRDDTRDFPFSRITGKARVVRVEKDGVAIEFAEDVSRLFVAN
jgi:hypothetical protein